MKDQDWWNEENYSYTKNLDDLGWAWEFIRRGDTYRETYAKIEKFIQHECGNDWKAQPLIRFPEQFPGESDQAWAVRAEEQGIKTCRMSPSRVAATQWNLRDMFDADLQYDPAIIKFILSTPFPAYFGNPLEIDEGGGTEKFKKKIIDVFKKNPVIQKIRPIGEIIDPVGLVIDENIILVAVDLRQPIKKQTVKASKFLTAYQKLLPQHTHHRKVWKNYLRMLDAKQSGTNMTMADIMIKIDPNLDWATNKNGLDQSGVGKHANDHLVKARQMANDGWKSILLAAMP